MSQSPRTLLPPSTSDDAVKMPAIGLVGCDDVSGVKYVDITKLDSELVGPFLKMFVKPNGLTAIHYFGEIKDHSTATAVLIVGTTLMYVCDKSATVLRQIHLTNIRSIIVSNTGYEWIGISLTPSANQPDLMIKPRSPEHLLSILKSLFMALTSTELPVVRTDAISNSLQLSSDSAIPKKVVPLSVVKPLPHRLWLSSNTGLDGWYAYQPPDTSIVKPGDVMYKSKNGHYIKSDATGRWGVYTKGTDLSFRAATEGQKLFEIKQWQKFDKDQSNDWISAPECSIGINKKVPSLENLLPTIQMSDSPGGSLRRSPSEVRSPVLYETMSLQQLRVHVANKTDDINALKKTTAEQSIAIKNLQKEIQVSQRDDNSVAELLQMEVGDSLPVIQCANSVIENMEKEALAAEAQVNEAQESIRSVRAKNEETIALESSLRQQIAAAETIQLDSKQKMSTIMEGTQDLVERSQVIAMEKERRVGELATLRAQHTDQITKLKSQHEAELVPLRKEVASLREQLRRPPSELVPEQNSELQTDIASLEQQLRSLQSEESALQEKHSSVISTHVKANDQTLDAGNDSLESVSPITAACNQLSTVLSKLDILEQQANETATLRWHLERATEKAEDMELDVRNATQRMKEIRSVYDQRILHATMALETSQMHLKRSQSRSSEIADHLQSELNTLKHKSIAAKKDVMSQVSDLNAKRAQLREESSARESKKRWSFEQELFLKRCNRNPSPPVESPAVQQLLEIDGRIQQIDKELLHAQQQTLQIDNNEHEMKQKRDAALQTLLSEERQVQNSNYHTPDDTEYQLQHIREKILAVEQNMEQFLLKISERRSEVDEHSNTLLQEKERLMSASLQLRRQEMTGDVAS